MSTYHAALPVTIYKEAHMPTMKEVAQQLDVWLGLQRTEGDTAAQNAFLAECSEKLGATRVEEILSDYVETKGSCRLTANPDGSWTTVYIPSYKPKH